MVRIAAREAVDRITEEVRELTCMLTCPVKPCGVSRVCETQLDFLRAKSMQKVKNYVFDLIFYETEIIKKTKLVWHQILHYVTHLFQNLTNFDRDITK